MIAVFISALLFGLVYPGSKIILSSGLGLVPFCFLYVGIRLITQLPFALFTGSWKIKSAVASVLLVSLGIIGACLQLSEFAGIEKNLPVSVVSFLIYSHPLWTVLLARLINKEAFTRVNLLKLFSALLGIMLITGAYNLSILSLSPALFYPILASFFISLWIVLSNKASKTGCTSQQISFYYDLFCLILMMFLFMNKKEIYLTQTFEYISSPPNLIRIAFYSIFIGLVPNILFYWGSKKVSAVSAGFVLLLEPVISTVIASYYWGEPLSPHFIVGAGFIIFASFPDRFLTAVFQLRPSLLQSLGILILFCNVGFGISEKEIYFVQIAPHETTDYTVDSQSAEMDKAVDLASETFRRHFPDCKIKLDKLVRRSSEEDLFSTIKTLSKKNPKAVLVGFSRSNSAKLAAKSANQTPILGISTGASTTDLTRINPNFFSITSPWTYQWDILKKKMTSHLCKKENSLIIYDPKNKLSNEFQKKFTEAAKGSVFSHSNENKTSFRKGLFSGKTCVFVAMQFSDSRFYLSSLIHNQWSGNLFGTGDWNMFPSELKAVLTTAHYTGLSIHIPTGWVPSANKNSLRFSEEMVKKLGRVPSPVSAYTYDSIFLASAHLCNNTSIRNIDQINRLPLLREYHSLSPTGNYLSPIYLLTYKGDRDGKIPPPQIEIYSR